MRFLQGQGNQWIAQRRTLSIPYQAKMGKGINQVESLV